RRPAPPPRRRRRPGLRQPPALPAEGDRRRAAAVAPGPPQPRARRRVLRGRERRRSRAGLPAPQLPRRQSQARAAGGDDTLLRPVVAASLRPEPARVDEVVAACQERAEAGRSPSPRIDRFVCLLAEHHPGDPGVVAALLLNPVTLQPGEAMYIPPGTLHAYLH